ncbi:MAG: AI-2E family transporter YdiK [Acetobacteraceae bacterium]
MSEPHHDVTRTTLAVLFIAGLGVASFWVIQPFLAAMIWAITLVIATWPLLLLVQRSLGGRRRLAVAVMTTGLVLVVVVPFWLAISTIVGNSGRIVGWAQSVAALKVPPPPEWIGRVPFFGAQVAQQWGGLSHLGVHEIAPDVAPYTGRVTAWFIAALGGLGSTLLQLLLTILIAPVMYVRGEQAAGFIRLFAHRLAGDRGVQAVRLAAAAIRGVALGVVVSSLIESAIGGLALSVSGVPFAAVLTAVMFMACVTQIGPGLVLIPVVIAMYWIGETRWASLLLICTIVVIGLDNLLRPALMKRGAHQPLLLMLIGVIGGVAGFGLVGIFLGPTILAVTFTLLQAWMDEDGALLPIPAAPSGVGNASAHHAEMTPTAELVSK